MKNILIYITLFTTIIILSGNCYAATDSLPACINTMKISTESFVTEYQYKGQRWFVFTKINPPRENEVSDKITHTKFYGANCKLVCTWTKGGITGINKVTPDTIVKAQIKRKEITSKDTIRKLYIIPATLPDTILKLALANNCSEIKEFLYQDKILYNFRYPIYYKQQLPEKGSVTIDDPYYDISGNVILVYKNAVKTTFTRAERWVPASVKRSDVNEVKNGVWMREKNNYKKIPATRERK